MVCVLNQICSRAVDVLVGLLSFPVLSLIIGPIATKDKALAPGILISCWPYNFLLMKEF